MDLKIVFDSYAQIMPSKDAYIHSTSQALQRYGVDTMEKLKELYVHDPSELTEIQGIGPCRMKLIQQVLCCYHP